MRKKVLACILGMSLLLSAATNLFAAEAAVRMGLIDLKKAVNESEQGKKAKIELETMTKDKQKALDEKGKALEKLKSDIEHQGTVMSAEARKNKEDELERLARDYQRALADSQNEVRKKEGELTGQIVKDLREIINTVAHEQKYDLILDNNPALIIFADKGFDITETVIKKFDESKGKPGNQ